MSDLKVPKRRVTVATMLADGSRRDVTVFLAEAAPGRTGGERLSDLLNGAGDFIPAVEAESRDMTFLNRSAVMIAEADAEAERTGADELTIPTEHAVEVKLVDGRALRGHVSYVLPPDRARLADFLCTSSVANLIREGKTFQIPSVMQTARGQGMVTLNDALLDLVKRGVVEPAEAHRKAVSKAEPKGLLERAGFPLEAAA